MPIIFSLFFGVIANVSTYAETLCGQEVDIKPAWSTSKDSSGNDRKGVIADRKDGFENIVRSIQLMGALAAAEAKNKNPDYKPGAELQKQLIKISGSLNFCMTQDGPASGTVTTLQMDKCIPVPNVVGLKLSAEIWTPGAAIEITSVNVVGKVTREIVEPQTLDGTKPATLCFENPDEVKAIVVYGHSTNEQGSRGNLMLDLLTSKTAEQRQP